MSTFTKLIWSKGDTATLNGGSLKLMDKFTNLRSSSSSTENDVNMQLAKPWTAIDRLLIIWKSDLVDKIKCNFFLAVVMSILLDGCITWMLIECIKKKARWELHENAMSYIEQILEVTSHKTATVWLPTFDL